ncbi:MAG: 30S ribosomal protein S4 [Promethearchaeota archaeon CR_4]|nr:MAG: 30S ribosomal protein S4 [Candidatus Lokiarchaeota archaeon CR_4]
MGGKGNTRYLKRLAAPKLIHIQRKIGKFFTKARAGPHNKEESLPLLHIVRDILNLGANAREARKIIKQGDVIVDGVPRTDHKFPVGIMDVIKIPKMDKHYRILPVEGKGFYPVEIPKKEADFKLVRIENKSTVKGGHIQLNLHDGRNLLLKVKDPRNPEEGKAYKTMDVLKISVPGQEIKGHVPLKEGSYGIIISGHNFGQMGTITNINKRFGINASIIGLKNKKNEQLETEYEYMFIGGKGSSEITLPEETV